MWLALLGIIIGLLIGFGLPVQVPVIVARYLSVALLASLDSAFGGLRASMEGSFNIKVFISGVLGNALLAAALTYMGDKLGVELYYAALFAFGYRMFQNLGAIRRHLFLHDQSGDPTASHRDESRGN
ncbi:MAG: small basic family protein [Chloroflexota bacterium]